MKRGLASLIDDLSAIVARLSRAAVISLAVVMTVVLFLQVVMRYVFNIALSWSEELSMGLFTWIVMIGGSVGVRDGFHVRISLLPDALPSRARLALDRLFDIGTLVFGIALLFAGHVYVRETTGQISAAVGYPIEMLHAAAPVCGALVALHALARCLSGQVTEDQLASVQAEVEAAVKGQ